ncbi:MAG: Ricin lectin [Myxococcaceae bacterium]|nr:Ricin lectin [Myxococcaceae bacterium]
MRSVSCRESSREVVDFRSCISDLATGRERHHGPRRARGESMRRCLWISVVLSLLAGCSSSDPTLEGAAASIDGGAVIADGGAITDEAGNVVGNTDGGSSVGVDAGRPKGPTRTTPKALADGFYPRAIRRANGTIVASVVTFLPASQRMGAIVFESTDEGVTFTEVGRVDDARTQGGLCCGTLYEVPRAIGAMPAGTLLWSASIGGDSPEQPMAIPIWKSGDGGRTWTFSSNVVVAPVPRKNGGIWEPEFSMLDDGSLVCHYSDETVPAAHSQKLVAMRSADGVTWGMKKDIVALAAKGLRPGMPNVRRPPGGAFVMSYEICALPNDSCTTHLRTSPDGWNWGDPTAAGLRPTTVDGKHFRHAPTLAWSSAPGQNGRFFLVGQMTYGANGAVAVENGNMVLASPEGALGGWYAVPAPVPVPSPVDNFCPNYSSTLLPLDDGTVGLEIASRWDGNACRSYFARGPLIDTSDGSEVKDKSMFRLVSTMSRLCLDVAGGSTTAGANVQQYTCIGAAAQKWTVDRLASGAIALRAAVSNMCLAVLGNAATPGANVEQQPCDGGPAQSWTLRAVGLGNYELVHAGTTTCLDVAGGSTAPGGNVAEWTCNDLAPQIWHFEAP